MAGAKPTKPELIAMLQKVVKELDEIRLFGHANASNLLDMEDDIIQNLVLTSEQASAMTAALRAIRASLNNMITPAAIRSVLDPIFVAWGLLISAPETDVPTIIRPRLRDAFNAAGPPDDVQTRGITFGTPAAGGGNVGDGELLRLPVGSDGEPLEEVYLETKTFEITAAKGADANTGSRRNREKFAVAGETAEQDEILRDGSGIDTTLTCVDSANQIVQNSGWDLLTGTEAEPTDIPSWTSSTAVSSATYTFESGAAEIYQPRTRATETRRSLNIKSFSTTLTQRFDLRSRTIPAGVPLMMQLAWNRELGTGDGTITIKLGTATDSVVMAAQTGWDVLRLTIGSGSWPVNFNENEIDVEISRTLGTTGSIHIDDLILVPWSKLLERGGGGSYWLMVGGRTPFLQGDKFTVTDALAGADGKIQSMIWRGYGLSLPSDAAPTVTDPA